MKLRTTILMKKTLEKKEVIYQLKREKLIDGLQKVINNGVLEIDSCYLLDGNVNKHFIKNYDVSKFHDKSSMEMYVNEVNIQAYLKKDQKQDPITNLIQGLLYVSSLKKMLALHNGIFEIIYSYANQEFITSQVNFHLLRNNERKWIRDDFEENNTEYILIEYSNSN